MAYTMTTEQKQILSDMPNGRVKQILRQLFEAIDTDEFLTSHTHGSITNAGAIGSTANLPVVTTTGGVLAVSAYGTGATQPAAGNHVHGGISNTGAIGTDANKVIVTGASGVLEAKALGGTLVTDIPAGNHSHAYSADSHAHGDVTNDGKVGTTANYVVMTTTGGAVTAKNFGTGATDPAAGNHTHAYSADSHVHGNITNAGKVGAAANLPLITGTDGLVQAGAFGTSANQFAEGNHTHAIMEHPVDGVEDYAFPPTMARAAELRTELAGANNDLIFTAVTKGDAGNDISVTYQVPQAPYPDTLEVTVSDTDILVQLAGTAAVAASSVFTIANGQDAGENETVTIGDMVYRFKADPTGQANDVDIGGTATLSCENLAAAINKGVGGGTKYHDDTEENSWVSAVAGTEIVTITAKEAGTVGNAIALAETLAQGSWDDSTGHMTGGTGATVTITSTASLVMAAVIAKAEAAALVTPTLRGSDSGASVVTALTKTKLTGGVDGTVGEDGEFFLSANGIYVSQGASTVSESNWHNVKFGDGSNKYLFEDFRTPPLCLQKTTELCDGTDEDEHVMIIGGHAFEYHNIGTQTILKPALVATGLDCELDEADGEGIEVTLGIEERSPYAFTIGTDRFFARLKFSLEDVSDAGECAFGFRKAAAYDDGFNDYTDYAAFNIQLGVVNTETERNNGVGGAPNTLVTTDTTEQDWADGETHDLVVYVLADGAVGYIYDGHEPATVAAFSFDSGDKVIPFFHFVHAADGSCAPILQEWEVGYLGDVSYL